MVFMTTTVFKKMSLLTLGLACAAGVIFSVGAKTPNSNVDVNANWDNETVRVYLDKTATINGLGWWNTDSTYIHIWDGIADTFQLMTKVDANLFYYDITAPTWALFTDNTKGMEFYVYNRDANQNQTYFAGGLFIKTNELNYVKLNSADGAAKQTFDLLNKEVEEVRTSILALTCSSTQSQVQTIIDNYNALRVQGKTNLNTWTVAVDDVTYYQRLSYFATRTGASL